VPPDLLVSPELARALAELSSEIGRQLGVLISRAGAVEAVMVGTERELVIPDLPNWRLGRKRLRGLRMVHTHLGTEALTQDDLADLALLRLDAMLALSVSRTRARAVFVGASAPPNPEGRVSTCSRRSPSIGSSATSAPSWRRWMRNWPRPAACTTCGTRGSARSW
jgi:GTP-binding protein HflX